MKKNLNPVLPEDFKLTHRKCLVCGNPTQGYGCWNDGYTCSRKCEAEKESQPCNFGEPNEHEHQMVHRPDPGAGSDVVPCDGERTTTSS